MSNLKSKLASMDYISFSQSIINSEHELTSSEEFNKENETLTITMKFKYLKDKIENFCDESFSTEEWNELAKKYAQENTYNTLDKLIEENDENIIWELARGLRWDTDLCDKLGLNIFTDIKDKNKEIQIIAINSNVEYTETEILETKMFTVAIVNI